MQDLFALLGSAFCFAAALVYMRGCDALKRESL
jgi:hypothetical protein